MLITNIKKIGNTNKYNVYIDEKWAGIFFDETLALYEIRTGKEFSEEEFAAIKVENDQKVAFDMAVCYLEKYVTSEKGIKDYLKKKGFDACTIKITLEKLSEYGFVNDESFARQSFESMSSRFGKRAISQKLKQKGISAEIVDGLLEEVSEEAEIENATAIAMKFAKNRQNDPKIKQKCLAHLVYKGYDYSVAQKATNIALETFEP